MRYFASAMTLLLLCTLAFPSFSLLYSTNGSASTDSSDFYAFSQPSALYLVGSTLYVADGGKGMIYLLNTSDGLARIRTLVSSSSQGYLSNPMHMDYDALARRLYIAGGTTGNILYYSGEGSTVDKWNPSTTNLAQVAGLALANGTIYIADSGHAQVVAYSRDTKAYSSIAVQSGGSDGRLSYPQDILLHGGKAYVSDADKGLIFVYDSNFTFLYTIGRGKGGVTLVSPHGMSFDGDRLYVADSGAGSAYAFSLDGYPLDVLNSSTPQGNLSYPGDVVASNGVLYVADTQNKRVEAFAINMTSGDPAVLALIAGANTTCSAMISIQSVAAKLGVAYVPVAYADSISSARQFYDDFAYSDATSLAQKAQSSCALAQSALTQSVELGIKQLVQSSQGKVAPYRNASSTNATLLLQFDNKAAAANFALSSKSYSGAADAALALPPLADSVVSGSQSNAAAQEQGQQAQALATAAADISSLLGRIGQLQSKSDAYRQGINLSGSRDLLALAQKDAEGGNFDAANHTMGLVSLDVSTYEATLDSAAKDIDTAMAGINAAELAINATASRTMLLPPDLSQERQAISQARQTVYSSPALAIQMASQASAEASQKSRDSQALSLAATSVLVVLFFMAILAAGFLIHIWGRKRKEL